MRREIAEQFVQRPWYTSGSTLQVSRLTAPRALLLGDAAHAVSAAFGQGVNAALEVCAFLASSGVKDRDAALEHNVRQHQQLVGPYRRGNLLTPGGRVAQASCCDRQHQCFGVEHCGLAARALGVLPQDCAVLGDIMAQEPDSIDAALERYERQRKPDVHALATMDHQVCPHNLNLLPWQIASCSVQKISVLDSEGPLLGKGVLAEELSGPGEHAYAG